MNITVGIPLIGDVPADAFNDHMRLAFRLGREAERGGHGVFFSCPQNIFPHDRARIAVFEDALRTHSEYIFFVDADTLVPREGFAELMRVQQDTKAPLISGHYYRRGNPFTNTWSKKIGDEFFQVEATEGIHDIDTCGLGCALVNVKWVVENLTPPYFTMEMGPHSCIVTDDIAFCTRIKQAGGLILGHAGVRCIHLGNRQAVCDETVPVLRKWFNQKKGQQDARSESLSSTPVQDSADSVQSLGGEAAGAGNESAVL